MNKDISEKIQKLMKKGPSERLEALELYFDDLEMDEQTRVEIKLVFRLLQIDLLQLE